jgi:hypothetical protein
MRIFGECRNRKFEMGCQPGNQGIDGFIHIGECASRMTQQRKLNGKAEPIGGTPAMADKFLVRSGEGVMARQAVRITGHAEQEPPFLVCQQLSTPQGGSPTSHNRPT